MSGKSTMVGKVKYGRVKLRPGRDFYEKNRVSCNDLGGRTRKPSGRLDEENREARCAVRRQVSHHRLSAEQLRQFGHRQGRRPHAVPSSGAAQLPRHGQCLGSRQAGRRRIHPAALCARKRRRLVSGHGGRHLSEPQLHRHRRSGICADPLGRPHLHDGLLVDA